jgi:GntR family transcriptional regulator / MocR family aminotransferase
VFAAGHYNRAVISPSLAFLPIIDVDRKAASPLHRQIYDGYRTAILRGELRPGQRVPSSRELASSLRVSRFPVLNAYAQLLAEGYLESQVGAGTFVSGSLPEQQMSIEQPVGLTPTVPSGPRRVARRSALYPAFRSSAALGGWGAFGVHQPALDHFPFQIWSNLVARHSRNPHASAIHNVNPLGTLRFREAIGDYLRTARGMKCNASQIMIVSGSQQALDITARVLFDPGDAVWIEEPGYRLQRSVLMAAGCRLIPVPVDNEGLDVAAGLRKHRKAKAAFVTPSHHYPLGSTMSATRRLQLLNWAQTSGAWVVEDDYDSEYRYESLPIASLHGLDANARVIYIGTLSKVLFPSLRLGYIVIPADLVDRFVAVRHAMDIFPPYLFQEVLSDFINEGHFSRHIRRMRQLYGEQRAELVKSLREAFSSSQMEIHGADAGVHLAVTFPDNIRDVELASRAARERLWLWPLSPSYLGDKPRQGLVLGFGSTPKDQIRRNVGHLKKIISEYKRESSSSLDRSPEQLAVRNA